MKRWRHFSALASLWGILAQTLVVSPSEAALVGGNFFNRGRSSLGVSAGGFPLGVGLINQNGNLDLTGGVPQATPFNSLTLAANALNVGNNFEINRRHFSADPRSGLANRLVRLEIDGSKQLAFANARGVAFGDFIGNTLSAQADKESDKFLVENIVGKVINNLEKRALGFNNQDLFDIVAVVNLSRRILGPELSRGTAKIQCPKLHPLRTAVNYQGGDKVEEVYENPPGVDPNNEEEKNIALCISTVAKTLNHLKPFGKEIIRVTRSMYKKDQNGVGFLEVPNLLQTFSLPALAVLFNPANNTNVCNHERRTSGSLVTAMEDLVNSAMDGGIYNLVKGYDLADGNRNLSLQTGVNLAVSRQFMGPLGVAAGLFASNLTDIAFVDGRESGVAKSGLNREIRAWANAVGRTFFTFDTNAEKSGIQLQAQNVRQTGRNGQAYGQGEGWRQDGTGSIDWLLTGAPDADGKMPIATEVPASAAHASAIALGSTSAVIVNGQCIKCHKGPKTTDGQQAYTVLAVNGTNTVGRLSNNFTNAMASYQNYLRNIGAFYDDGKGASRDILWDTYQKIKQPKSIDYAANQLAMSGNQLRGMMERDPSLVTKLQLDKNGNLDAQNWLGGGKCAVKFELAGRRGGRVSNGALLSTEGPKGHVAQPGEGAEVGAEAGEVASKETGGEEKGSTLSDSPNNTDLPHA